MKKRYRLLGAALAVYVLLLVLLWRSEQFAQRDITIHSFWDALWYSIITMTTVGYGDTAPVTPVGRAVGMVFALASIGVLTALIALGVNLLWGELIPRLRLLLGKGKKWYIFTENTPDSRAVAAGLLERGEDALLIFPPDPEKMPGDGLVHTSLSWRRLCSLREGPEDVCLFCLGQDRWQNYALGLRAARAGIQVYALADPVGEDLPDTLHLFSPEEAAARQYWLQRPLKRHEDTVVLIGAGAAARSILEQGLLVNVFPQGRQIHYHVFGDFRDFALLHRELCTALAPGDGEDDILEFHQEDWQTRPELLEQASRIILSGETDAETLEVCQRLRQWFVCPGKVHLRLDEHVPGLSCFGRADRLITVESVMQDELNRRARTLHQIYSEGSPEPTSWESLSSFLRASNMAAADHVPVKVRVLLGLEDLKDPGPEELELAWQRFDATEGEGREALRRCEHRRWMRFYQMYNWTFNEKRDNRRRRHPLMVPYEQLSAQEQAKDDYAWELLGRLAKAQEAPGEARDEYEPVQTERDEPVQAEPVPDEPAPEEQE